MTIAVAARAESEAADSEPMLSERDPAELIVLLGRSPWYRNRYFELDGNGKQEPLDRLAADLAFHDRLVGHALETPRTDAARKATIFIRRQGYRPPDSALWSSFPH